jgi:hypothetical protein
MRRAVLSTGSTPYCSALPGPTPSSARTLAVDG